MQEPIVKPIARKRGPIIGGSRAMQKLFTANRPRGWREPRLPILVRGESVPGKEPSPANCTAPKRNDEGRPLRRRQTAAILRVSDRE